MKTIVLTVAEFLLLIKVQDNVNFKYAEVYAFIEENSKNHAEDLSQEIPEMTLETKIFDDVVDSVQRFLDDVEDDYPEYLAVESLLNKLQAVVEETTTEESFAEEILAGENTDDCPF